MNKIEEFDSSRPFNEGGFLDQNVPTLAATKKKNLKRKLRQPSSNLSSNNSKSSLKSMLSQKSLSYLACSCMDRREILVVDDNIFNIVTLQTILEYSLKIQSDKALNGKEAVEKVLKRAQEDKKDPCHCLRRRQNYKLIFMDCNMPIMDGFQATLKIREHFT